MNTLLTIVRNVALLVLISSFWEMLVPAGKLRQPVRLVIGLLLVSCIVVPVTDVLARGPGDWQVNFPELTDTEAVLAEGQAISDQLGQIARSEYEEDMARQVASICLLADGVTEARAAVSANSETGGLGRVFIAAELAAGSDAALLASKLTGLISTFFSVEEQYIECQIKVKEVVDDAGTTEDPDRAAGGDAEGE